MGIIRRNRGNVISNGEHQTSFGYIRRQRWSAPALKTTTSVVTSITTAVVTTSGITNPDFPQVISIVSGGASHNATGNVVINGTDIRGNTISDTIALNGSTTVNGVKAFKTVTSVDTTGVSGIGAAATVTVGTTNIFGLDRLMDADEYIGGSVATNSSSTGVFEATRATITVDGTNISGNTVLFNTACNGTKVFRAVYVTKELTTNSSTTS